MLSMKQRQDNNNLVNHIVVEMVSVNVTRRNKSSKLAMRVPLDSPQHHEIATKIKNVKNKYVKEASNHKDRRWIKDLSLARFIFIVNSRRDAGYESVTINNDKDHEGLLNYFCN